MVLAVEKRVTSPLLVGTLRCAVCLLYCSVRCFAPCLLRLPWAAALLQGGLRCEPQSGAAQQYPHGSGESMCCSAALTLLLRLLLLLLPLACAAGAQQHREGCGD